VANCGNRTPHKLTTSLSYDGEAVGSFQACEEEMSQLIAQLQSANGRATTAEAAAQEAHVRAQQLEATATTAQEAVERMQTANQDLIKTCALRTRAPV
jgi:septal ring factor EnvC (AmiA/AmiB activator)